MTDKDEYAPYVPMTIEEAKAVVEKRKAAAIAKYGERTPEEQERAKHRWKAIRNRTNRRMSAQYGKDNISRG